MENNRIDPTTIKGWGIDADPENDPTYPYRKREMEDHQPYPSPDNQRPRQQAPGIEVLKSIERPNFSAVIGTSTPPSGLSGQIRRFAYRFSESSYARWLPLILADRVNMVEGIIDDIRHGKFPNPVKERGWTAEWKYNRQNLIKNVAIGAVVTGALVALYLSRNKFKSKFT